MIGINLHDWRSREATLRAALLACTDEEIAEALHSTLTESDWEKLSNLVEALWHGERLSEL